MCTATAIAISGSRIAHCGIAITTAAREDAGRGPDVGHQVLRVGLDRDAVVLARDLQHDARGREVRGAGERRDDACPSPRRASGCGSTSRMAADQKIATAATRISAPSTPLEKYSALSWP